MPEPSNDGFKNDESVFTDMENLRIEVRK